jgi:hypothetical protein
LDWELAMRRQAVLEWRDRQILAAYALFNSKAQGALEAFEAQVAKASVVDSVWDPAGFADFRIDELMQERMRPALRALMSGAESELVGLGKDFAPLGAALARSDELILPTAPKPEAPPEAPASGLVREAGTEREVDWWIARLPGMAAERATSFFSYASETASWLMQDKVGLRDRLRAAAAERIATQWMGGSGKPRPVLSQVIAIIDEVSHEARTMLL